ncbi:hypothetical protein R3P38DRAFT_2632155 [Favolaschia claudopus]|uniref:DUF6535 domain-containing protein n=1 Tax=Favolaschia claudopus TaxID=2862362 RepID=A0AAW0B0W3_9AGAR
MEGMLIFAGLFSAVLTAFLVESYKTLNRDPEDLTVLLLTRISEQIVASANGSASAIPLPLKFENDPGPTRAAFACNALWFLSLGLSLSCALIATLVEQWAREFLHRTDIHSAPIIRARVFSFLYYGLRRFNMHAIVDVIPLLLHLALLLFFSGLVAFLIPVNIAIAIIAAAMLFVLATAYSALTVFPLRYLDSPYRTPLTGAFWNVHQYFKTKRQHRGRAHPHTEGETKQTMIAALTRAATEVSKNHEDRDRAALTWTVKSLADDTELEPFVDAIPDILWGPEGRREPYHDIIRTLVVSRHTKLGSRIVALYKSCETGLLSPTTLKRRRIICMKAIWSIGPFLSPSDLSHLSRANFEKQRKNVTWDRDTDLEIPGLAHSMWALIPWMCFQFDAQRIKGTLGTRTSAYTFMHMINDLWPGFPVDYAALENTHRHTWETAPYLNLFDYFRSAIALHTLPYRFHSTLKFIELPQATPAPLRYDFDHTFTVAMQNLLPTDNTPEPGWRDTLVKELRRETPYWPPEAKTDRITLHSDFLRYLNDRISDEAVSEAMTPLTRMVQLWEVFANHLETVSTALDQQNTLTAMWRLLSLGLYPPPPLVSRFLDACLGLNIPSVPSVVAILKARHVRYSLDIKSDSPNSMDRWLVATVVPSTDTKSEHVNAVASTSSVKHSISITGDNPYVVLYTEFLEACTRSTETVGFPHEAARTFRFINLPGPLPHPDVVQKTNQIRFAVAFRNFFESPLCADLRPIIVHGSLMSRHTHGKWGSHGYDWWLSDPTAREIVVATLTQYAEEMASLDVYSMR